nr:right-handed parallel beta-helix repeat-containing protein [Bacteroidota bacterium]
MNTIKVSSLFVFLISITSVIFATEYHVSKNGNNKNNGSESAPFLTISFAAQKAQPGDVIIVHDGTYRERVTPQSGGASDAKRIVYRAAKGERVEIKGSEVITEWERFKKDVWKVTIPNTFFGDYNPYKDIITGDWFYDYGRSHHTGEVYLNDKSLYETNILEDVLTAKTIQSSAGREIFPWYCESNEKNTYIYANFQGHNPNKEMVEINVRKSCFYPEKPGRNYITVSGFHLSQAATQWAPPTAEQIGIIGTHWSKGWIIENNVISNSRCTGITLGKDRETGHNVWSHNPCKDGATHYNEVIFRALQAGWSRDKIGSHIVRNNTIFDCEQAGIVGSMGGVFSHITNNHIYNIWTKRLFAGAEMAGIKIHGSIDMLIKNNHIHNVGRGIWIDWMAQGTRITGNLMYHNTTDDLFSEVNHGPYLVDNNIFLSETALRDWSEGGAFVHNLFNGKVIQREVLGRFTPYHMPHSTEVAGLRNIHGGDNRFYNNVFAKGTGLEVYNNVEFPIQSGGNVYFNSAKPCNIEPNYIMNQGFDPMIKIVKEGERVFLHLTLAKSLEALDNPLVTTELLGKTKNSGQAFVNPDGSFLQIDTDYFGKKRSEADPSTGPFENSGEGKLKLKVW